MSDMSKGYTAEIWFEILKHLPVKTLGQCRCVCKPWNNLIVSQPFISAHLRNYSQNAANSLVLYRQFSDTPKKQDHYTLFHDSAEQNKGHNLNIRHSIISPFVASKSQRHFRVVGSASGLVCLSDDLFGYTYTVVLWNPLICRYIKLPVPGATYHVSVGAYISMLGFGYDSKKDDHKVVRLVYLRGKDALDTTPPKVELYSVREGKWRWVSANYLVDQCVCDIRWSQCFLNGNIHWISWERDAKTRVFQRSCLLLFNVADEIFKIMKLPEPLSKVIPLTLSVSGYDEKLSVVYSELSKGLTGNEMKRCEIWVKNEYSVGSSWCKMVNIDLDSSTGLGWVQCLRKSGDVLGFTKRGTLVSYDPSTKQMKVLGSCGRWRSWFTCGFTESLVLLDRKGGVGTYEKAAMNKKKRFSYSMNPRTLAQTMEEAEVEVDDCDGDESDLSGNIYSGDFMIYEAMMKFEGGNVSGDLPEFLSRAGLM